MQQRDKPARRNWTAAANPLLRKGGVHQKSRKSARKQARDNLRRDTRRGFDLRGLPAAA
ncbi:MAG TPA: hypothetical protein VF267_12795 [Gammaproteobacteria bacterium]